MNTLTEKEVCEEAHGLTFLLFEAIENNPQLHKNDNLSKLAEFLKNIKVGCLDFSQTDFDDGRGFIYSEKDHTFLLNILILREIFDRASRLSYYADITREELRQEVVGLYFFHEAFHMPQGIGNYEDIQLIKEVAGKSQLGEFDTLADFVAARGLAAVITHCHDGDAVYFHKVLYETLYKSYNIGLRAFNFSPGDTHKIERALSIFLVRRRILKNLSAMTLSKETALGLHVRYAAESGKLLVFTLENTPAKKLLFVLQMQQSVVEKLQSAVAFGNVKFIEDLLEKQLKAA